MIREDDLDVRLQRLLSTLELTSLHQTHHRSGGGGVKGMELDYLTQEQDRKMEERVLTKYFKLLEDLD